jgi:tRNA G46 methylase TrmB
MASSNIRRTLEKNSKRVYCRKSGSELERRVRVPCFFFIIMLFVCVWGTTLSRKATAFSSPGRIHVSAALKDTLYSINDQVCPPTDEQVLRKVVEKHCHSLHLYLDQKPIARHTQDAFDIVKEFVANATHAEGIILDRFVPCIVSCWNNIKKCFGALTDIILSPVMYSGCGTARSSLLLGSMYPNHLVIGIDRSLARLWRNVKFRKGIGEDSVLVDGESKFEKGDKEYDSSMTTIVDDGDVPAVQRASDNVILVRAELSDFWRLCLMEEWNICQNYLLYPNPYPKKSRLKSRWYAHPAFPILLGLGGNVVVRSNWKGYLEEFSTCVEIANECMGFSYTAKGPTRQSCCNTTTIAWTNFEIKYTNVGEPTYELILSQQQGRAVSKKC